MDNAKIIAVDFDGTLVENKWPEIGAPIEKNIAKVKAEQEAGAKIILWTNRVGEPLEKALAFCEAQGIHLDAVNKNLPEIIKAFGTDCRKIFANEYWDDRAVPMSEKDIGEFSDGFHTFNSLYHQRLILFAAGRKADSKIPGAGADQLSEHFPDACLEIPQAFGWRGSLWRRLVHRWRRHAKRALYLSLRGQGLGPVPLQRGGHCP